MTMQDAYQTLQAAWPGRSFNIEVSVWCHAGFSEPPRAEVEFSVWDEDGRTHHRGPTLEIAMGRALETTGTLPDADQALVGLTLQGDRA